MRTASSAVMCFAILVACACGATPAAPPPSLTAPAAPLVLAPGEVAELSLTASGIAGGRIATPRGDEQLVVVIASTRLDTSGDELPWSIDSSRAPAGANASLVTGCALSADAWKSKPVAAETAPIGTAVPVGTTRTLHASTGNGVEDIQVKAIAIGKHAIVWADVTAAHPAVLDAPFVSQFLADFDDTILPRAESVFGVESDIDRDGHIGLVFTPLTHQTGVAFFSGCDLAKWTGCATSNAGEYLWLTPPNAIAPPYNTPNAMKEILAHELSHLIHFNRKVLRNAKTEWTDSGYMIEGMGGLAQDVVGMQAGNLYVTQAGLSGIARFSLGDVLVDRTPYDESRDKTRDGLMRGGSYLFVRWLYDRAGGDAAKADGAIEGHGGTALLRALLDAPASVANALPAAAKSTAADVAIDFFTALAMSNRDEAGGVAPANACFAYLPAQVDPVTKKQRGADAFAKFHGTQMNGPATTDAKAGKLRAGGVAYVVVGATTGASSLDLTVTVDAKASPRVRVGRVLSAHDRHQ